MQSIELIITCSPGPFRKCKSGQNFRQQAIQEIAVDSSYETVALYEHIANESGEASQEVFSVASGSSGQNFVPIGGSCESPEAKNVWLDAPTKLLIPKVKD